MRWRTTPRERNASSVCGGARIVRRDDRRCCAVGIVASGEGTHDRFLVGQMPENHRRFQVSFERGEPDWTSLNNAGAEHLPGVQWRQKNVVGPSANQRTKLVSQLEQVPSEDSSSTATGASLAAGPWNAGIAQESFPVEAVLHRPRMLF